MSSFIKKPHARGKLSSSTPGKGKKGSSAVKDYSRKGKQILNASVNNGTKRIVNMATRKR